MSRHSNLPFHFYINVDNNFLGKNMPRGVTKGIWHGIYCRPGQLLMCHVLLESGANWTGLPIHAISVNENFCYNQEILMPWSAMGEELDVFHTKYLEGLKCSIIDLINDSGRHTGIIIDWKDGFSRYPQEHKPLNLIELKNGQFGLYPNNFILYEDKHFVEKEAKQNLKHYKRGDVIYWGS